MWVHKDLDPIVFRKTFLHNLFDILAWDMRRIEITILAQKMLPKSLDKLKNGILLPKLFWPWEKTVSDREKFSKFLRSLEQFFI